MRAREFPTGSKVFKTVVFNAEEREVDPDQPLRFVASDETVDRYGDIVRANGWDLRQYKQNPIALFSHNSEQPVGTCKVWIDGDKQLMSDINIAKAGTAPIVDYVRALLEQRILRAVSVGFLPTAEPNYLRDEKNQQITGYEFVAHELLEISLVSVPANPRALAVARSLKMSDETVRQFFNPAYRGISTVRARLELDKLRARS